MDNPYDSVNSTELIQIIRKYTGTIVKKNTPRERLLEITIGEGEIRKTIPSEEASTNQSRPQLEKWLTTNWSWVQNQIPCKGEGRGKCTTYPCSELQHLECFTSSKKFIV